VHAVSSPSFDDTTAHATRAGLRLEIHIDIGWLAAFFTDETLEHTLLRGKRQELHARVAAGAGAGFRRISLSTSPNFSPII
jgi:hypothetical protein